MKSSIAVFLLCASTAFAANSKQSVAYSADIVVLSKGETTTSHVASDGIRTLVRSGDGKSGSFTDKEKNLQWVFGPSFGCIQVPAKPGDAPHEEIVGSETVSGHPAKKVKVTATLNDGGSTKKVVMYEWRATDLQGLVIRRKSEADGFESHLEHIALGAPDPKNLVLPSPPCKYDEMADTTRNAPQAGGGYRKIRFSDASCKQLVPLPLTLSIPSDYAVRSGGPQGCVWGASDDLDRVLAERNSLDFESIRRGVFWCRVSDSTEYDPANGFVNDQGPQSRWKASFESMGARNVVVTSKKIGEIPTSRVTASMNGQRVYMLYLAVPGTDSPAILINYHPAGGGSAADDDAWKRFLDSIERVAN